MRKINPLALSVIGGIFILAIVYILFWVLLLCLESPNAAKEAINILGSYFGGVATLWAAFIAAYLFNDWKDQHNKGIDAQLCMKVMDSVYDCDLNLLRINTFMVDYLSTPHKISYQQELNINLKQLRDIINIMASSLCILGHIIPEDDYNQEFLPNLQSVIDDLEEYYKAINTTFRGLNTPMPIEFIQSYNTLCEGSRIKYRSVIEKLRRYYKA